MSTAPVGSNKALDFFYSAGTGAEFSNYRLEVRTTNGMKILDPVKSATSDVGGDAEDMWMNTVYSLLDLGSASYIFNTYRPTGIGSDNPPRDFIDWSVFDTLPGDGNVIDLGGGDVRMAPWHLARVLVSPDAAGSAIFRAFDSESNGVETTYNFAFDFISPVITSPNTANTPENTTTVMTVTATDASVPAQPITFSIIGGVDQAKFNITAGGALSFIAAPNFEAPSDANGDNVYVVTVQASDGAGGTAQQTLSVTVMPVNDNNPVFTSPSSANVLSNTTAVLTATATDADVPAQPVTFSIAGGADQAKFNITSAGILTFVTPPNYDSPTDADGNNVYLVAIRASDGAGGSTLQAVSVFIVSTTDYGDSPDASAGTGSGNYNTRLADGGPRHSIVPQLRIGAAVDGEGGTLQNPAANADDVSGALPDDEDGVVYPAADLVLTVGAQPTINLRVTNTTGTPATLYGWIDYNANGVFDNATERASVAVPAGTNNGLVTLTFPTVTGVHTGTTYARFRLGTTAGAANSTGDGGDGEVEDYRATILHQSSGLAEPAKTRKIANNLGGFPNGVLANGDKFGSSIAAIGDLDGDGIEDMAVGAPSEFGSTRPGEVHIVFLNANGTVKGRQTIGSGLGGGPTLASEDYFGHSVTSLGDLDGDGITDLAVGASKDDTGGDGAGAVYVLFMNANGTVKGSQKIASGVGGGPTLAAFERFGHTASALGDLDGDGLTELAVGGGGIGTTGTGRGAVHILFLNSNGTVKSSQKIAHNLGGGPSLADGDSFGSSLSSLGDIDGDGVSDLAVGTRLDDTGGANRGAVHVLFMNANGTAKAFQKIASGFGGGPALSDNDSFGIDVTSLGDLDGDGITDLAVGAYRDDTGGLDRGGVHVLFLNSNGTARATHKIASGVGGGPTLANYDTFGRGMAALGDLDGDGITELAVGAERDDTGGNSRGAAYVLFLKSVNRNPTFSSPNTANIAENTAAVMTVTATDPDLPPQTITFSLVGGADQAKFGITPAGALSFLAPPNFEAPTDAGANNVYVVTVQASDGNGGTATQTISVTVTPVNDNNPVITSANAANVAENTTTVLTVTASDADLPVQAITFSIVGGADQARFSITSGGALSFNSGPNFEVPTDANSDNVYVVVVQASDGGLTNVQAILVTVTPVNDNNPVITSSNTASIPENTTAVGTVTATDADLPAQSVSYSIVGGADQAKFGITAGGALSFLAPPDFEAPTDAGANNVYVVTVQASDGSGGTTTQSINVTVTPVNDNNPVITSADAVNVAENSTAVLTVTATDADLPPQSTTFSIAGGADQAKFGITAGGVLSFNSAPNFEAPTDSNGDNVYVVIVQASDGSFTDIQAMLVTVTNVFEGLPGDYNVDNSVDAADYVVWRKTRGTNVTPFTGADGSGNGVIDQADHLVWSANFGRVASAAGSVVTQTPEAATSPSAAEAPAASIESVVGALSSSEPVVAVASTVVALPSLSPLNEAAKPLIERKAIMASPPQLPALAFMQTAVPREKSERPHSRMAPAAVIRDSALEAWLASLSAATEPDFSTVGINIAAKEATSPRSADEIFATLDLAFESLAG